MSFGSSSSSQQSTVNNIREDYIFNSSGVGGDVLNIGQAGGNITVERLDEDTVNAALNHGRELSQNAIQESLGFGSDALAILGDNLTMAVGSQGDIVRNALEETTGLMEWNAQQNRQAIERALSSVDSARSDDSAETMQSLFKWGAVAVGAAALAYSLKG